MHKREKDGGAVIAALVSATSRKVLLVIQPHHPCGAAWKFPGGEIEAPEHVLVALAREIGDETRFQIPISRGPDQQWFISDPGIEIAHQSMRKRRNRKKDGGEHEQHFFVLKVANEHDILSRGNECHREDDGELIKTGIFDLDTLRDMPNFLGSQRPLLEQIFMALEK
jgi:ADP-ribose pyrophosphatase YjhB (NUDIX family)